MSLQSERLELLMQRLSLSDMLQGYAALAEQAAQRWCWIHRTMPSSTSDG